MMKRNSRGALWMSRHDWYLSWRNQSQESYMECTERRLRRGLNVRDTLEDNTEIRTQRRTHSGLVLRQQGQRTALENTISTTHSGQSQEERCVELAGGGVEGRIQLIPV